MPATQPHIHDRAAAPGRRRPAFLAASLGAPWLGAVALALAADAPPSPEALCSGGTIGKIVVERVNVFDPKVPGEDHWAFRLVNSLHSPNFSRERMIRRVVTLREGEPCSLDRLEEAERDLRLLEFLQDAWVDPIAREGDRVTVRVRVRDAWSTRVRLSLSYWGGVSQTAVALYEVNLLGTGTNLGWEYQKDQDRIQRTLSLISPPALPKHFQFQLLRQNNSDGKVDAYEVMRPFYQLDARWAADILYRVNNSIEKVYVGPEVVDRYRLHDKTNMVEVGLAPSGFRDDQVRRWYFGVQHQRVDWSLEAPLGAVPNRPDLAPRRREQLETLFRYTWQRIDFRRVQFYNRATRVEDFDLGTAVELGGGLAAPVGDFNSGGFIKTVVRRGFDLGEGSFFVTSGSFEIAQSSGDWFDAVTQFTGAYYKRLAPLRTLVFQSEIDVGSELEGPKRFLLGADTGLRGYRSRAFSGESMVLLNLEHRWFTEWQWLHLIRPGLVAFLELGGAWDGRFSREVVHPDIGLGLRLAVLRSAHGTTLHFDVGYPLARGADPGNEKLRFTFVTANSF